MESRNEKLLFLKNEGRSLMSDIGEELSLEELEQEDASFLLKNHKITVKVISLYKKGKPRRCYRG